MTGYEWLVGKVYHGCNPFPAQDVPDGRKIKVLAVANDLPGEICYTSGDRPQSDTARRIVNAHQVDNTRALVEVVGGARTWATYAKWVAREIKRQHDLGLIVLCPDCGSTDTVYTDECETTMGHCNTCEIYWELDNADVQADQDRQARGRAPLHPVSDLLEHGPLDYVE